jgi:uncharacterized protein
VTDDRVPLADALDTGAFDADALCGELRERLLDFLRPLGRIAVAYSGGVDSAVVAMAAYQVDPSGAVAVTGVSASLATSERQLAQDVARLIGIRHVELSTQEFQNPDYLKNGPDRCFHCKTQLYTQIHQQQSMLGFDTLVNGANTDDLGDYRPGMQAARDFAVISPLAECGINKRQVRQLAKAWGLPVWEKPASPCLSSRVAYGEQVSPERLAMIEQGEQILRELGFAIVRVRYHANDLARIEVDAADLHRLADSEIRSTLTMRFRALGFQFVTLDLEGFRSGSLNVLVPLT